MTQATTSVIILAAGMGKRMHSTKPKVMHNLAGRPMISHVLETVSQAGYKDIILVVGKEMEKNHELFLPYQTVQQKERLGTGHAVKIALETMDDIPDNILILYGDTPLISSSNLNHLVKIIEDGSEAALLAFKEENLNSYGRVFVKDNYVEKIIEASDASDEELKNNLCNSGIMAVSGQSILESVNQIKDNNSKKEFYLTDIVSIINEGGGKTTFVECSKDECVGINNKSDLAQAEAVIQERYRENFMKRGVTLLDPKSVFFSFDTILGQDVEIGPFTIFGPGVSVGSNVKIKGFCHLEHSVVSDHAVIGPYARLRPGATIKEDARVGNFVEIKNSQIESGAKVNHLAYVGDANVGKGSNIGAGTITANYDGFNKSKTEIGDGVSIGSNSVLVAPVNIGDGSITGAGTIVRKDIPDNSISITEGSQKTSIGAAGKYRAQKKRKVKKNNEDL
ncbi:MAG: bifunctional UDP-N-acetylglucosamine diphosphorylase/glucosamine-1-phosphate N-acetyltransferase GlmU [Pseudomonadota bacterium]|nr:bifunctional UDP-N-acetylglucosamine diphosphorylase/glucosamine-1-phosphate N-acetyltransferase GlmU [Pseudomonadota bacterium]